jgi:hypothetical protein
MKHIYANEPTRWTRYSTTLLAALTKATNKSPRSLGRRSKHLFDWMAHGANLSKGSTPYTRIADSLCRFCGVPETQQHINAACTHPPLVETRRTCRKAIDEFFLCFRHHHIPKQDTWVIPLLDHMEANIWLDSKASGDLWNGRSTEDLLQSLQQESAMNQVSERDFKKALKRIQSLTALLQQTQRFIYSTRRAKLLSLEAKTHRDTVIALRRRRVTRRNYTLYSAWQIPYSAPNPLRRRRTSPPQPHPLLQPPPSNRLKVATRQWLQYSKASRASQTLAKPTIPPLHSRISKTSKREDHRTQIKTT